MHSFISWVGGKRTLAKTISAMMPQHHCYAEVFGGAGWVLFNKEPSKVEVWNDINSDLVNLFRVARNQPHTFKRRQYFLLSSREEYKDFQKTLKSGNFKDDIDRAIAFYYCIKNSFGSGIFTGYAFGPQRGPKYPDCLESLEATRKRLKDVYIDNLSYEKLIPNYDRPDTLFYCDPPYMVCLEKPHAKYYYQRTFTKEDHVRLRDILKSISGKFILSYDDHLEIKRLYKDFNIREVPITYSINNRKGVPLKKSMELLITNFDG